MIEFNCPDCKTKIELKLMPLYKGCDCECKNCGSKFRVIIKGNEVSVYNRKD